MHIMAGGGGRGTVRWVATGLVTAWMLSTAAGSVLAQDFASVGTRALGMAGAFVAVADDATATYWNPAGLSQGAFMSLLIDYQRTERWLDPARSDTPAMDDSAAFVGLSTNSAGFSYYRLRTNQIARPITPDGLPDPTREDEEGEATVLSLITHHAALTGAQLLGPGVSLGSTLRYVRGSFGTAPVDPSAGVGDLLRQAADLNRKGKNEWDLDLGLMVGSPSISVGLVGRNLRQPTFTAPGGATIRMKRQVRAGFAVRPLTGLRVATDIDLTTAETIFGLRRGVAAGAEHWFSDWFALRGGARFNLEGDDSRPVGSFGLSVALSTGAYIDMQLTRGRDQLERGWSVAGRIGF